jgi:hypothetical protein
LARSSDSTTDNTKLTFSSLEWLCFCWYARFGVQEGYFKLPVREIVMTGSATRVVGCVLCVLIVLGIWSSPSVAQGSGTDLVVSGKPLGYWISQTTSPSRSEDIDSVVKALTEAVSSEDHWAKVAASDALATLGTAAKPALPVLLEQLSHELGWVRAAAAGAVVAMGKEAVPTVVELFEKQVGGPSVRAAFVLGAIGADAKAAVPSIVAIMKNASPVMQVRYTGILNQIDPDNFPGNTTTGTLQAGRVDLENDGLDTELSSISAGWPQFHGPNRDSICRERGLLQKWPEGGPKRLWTLKGLGKGYSSVAVTGGRIFTMGDRPTDGGEDAQFVVAFDLHTRAELWAAHETPNLL